MKTFLILCVALLISSCGTPTPYEGITTIPNKLKGAIVNSSGTSVANATVYLYGDTTISLSKTMAFNGMKLLAKDTTDNFGQYHFNVHVSGLFNILSISDDSSQIIYKQDIAYNPNIEEYYIDTIETAASITGVLDTSRIDTLFNYFVSLENTPFIIKINSDGSYTLPVVPKGFWSIKLTEQDTVNKTQKSIIIKDIEAKSSEKIIIEDKDDTTEIELENEEYDEELDEIDEIDDPEEVDEVDDIESP